MKKRLYLQVNTPGAVLVDQQSQRGHPRPGDQGFPKKMGQDPVFWKLHFPVIGGFGYHWQLQVMAPALMALLENGQYPHGALVGRGDQKKPHMNIYTAFHLYLSVVSISNSAKILLDGGLTNANMPLEVLMTAKMTFTVRTSSGFPLVWCGRWSLSS
jgi:hypothetical protein